MKADEVPQVAERCALLWPTQEVSQRYLDGLIMSVGAYPVGDLLRALDELSAGDASERPREFLPPPGVVQARVIEIRQHDAQVQRSLHTQRAPTPEISPEAHARGKRSLVLLREVIDAAREGHPLSEREIGAEIRRLGLEPDDRDLLVSCRECGDVGWIACADGGLRPCERCRRETFDLWLGGHFRPDHHCASCEERKRGGRRRAG